MAHKYYNMAKAAEILGISADNVKQLQQSHKLHGYRDGADWKFKVEDIDRLAEERLTQKAEAEGDEGDVLLSEVELGESDPTASGTVIGLGGGNAGMVADSDIMLGIEAEAGATGQQDEIGSKVSQFEELDLTLEEDLTLEDSQIDSSSKKSAGSSDIGLAGGDLEDDDLVLGGSGTGSDITIGGDSGISLVDPSDSGLSLEEPLDLAGSGGESLELGEDDMISLEEEADTEAPTELKTDDDFLLTPLEEVTDDESESGSQVIALDTESEGDEMGTMIAGGEGAAGGMAAMLDEDLSAEPADGLGVAAGMEAAPLGAQPGGFAEGAPVAQTAALPETPYSVWNIVSLACCTLFLMLCGMFMYDLLRNMWSWDSAYPVSSSMMDMILGWIEG